MSDERPFLAGVCGFPIAQSKSPVLFAHWFAAHGIAGHYVPLRIAPADFEAVLGRFRGEIEQVPPMYSALKHQGERLYRIARRGESVERPPRPVTIHKLELLGLSGGVLSLRVRCSKGTYVRVLVEDLARAAGTLAHVTALRRLRTGPFDEAGMVTLEALEARAGDGREALDALLLPPDAALPDLPAVELEAGAARRLRQGQAVSAEPGRVAGRVRLYGPGGVFIGLGESDGAGGIAPRRLLRPAGET